MKVFFTSSKTVSPSSATLSMPYFRAQKLLQFSTVLMHNLGSHFLRFLVVWAQRRKGGLGEFKIFGLIKLETALSPL